MAKKQTTPEQPKPVGSFKEEVEDAIKSHLLLAPDTAQTWIGFKQQLLNRLGGEVEILRDRDAQIKPARSGRVDFTVVHRGEKEQRLNVIVKAGDYGFKK